MKPSPDRSDTKEEERCLTCGKMFKQLSRHKCKGHDPASPRPATANGFQSLVKSSQAAGAHNGARPKVKGHVSSPAGPSVVVERRQSSSDSSNSGTQMCLTCGQTFKQISRHKCKRASPSPSPSPNGSGSPDRGLKEEGEVCRFCGQTFKQISRHRCKAEGAHNGARPKVKQEPSGDGPAPKAAGNGTTASTGEQPCPTCGVIFKRLRQHKCKYTSDADTLSGPAPPRAGSGRTDLNPPEPPQGAHGCIPTLDVAALEAEADKVMEALGIEPAAKPNQEAADFFAAEVTVKREEKEAVTSAVNPFRDRIVERLDESTNWKWDYFNSGSSYDGTKVCIADCYHHQHHHRHHHCVGVGADGGWGWGAWAGVCVSGWLAGCLLNTVSVFEISFLSPQFIELLNGSLYSLLNV